MPLDCTAGGDFLWQGRCDGSAEKSAVFNLFRAKCPVTPGQADWIDRSMRWFSTGLHLGDFKQVTVVVPTLESFPDPWTGDAACLETLSHRIARLMGVDTSGLQLHILDDRDERALTDVVFIKNASSSAAGTYHSHQGQGHVSIAASQLQSPMSLVATIAHELGHVILLGGGHVKPDQEDHELLTDLLTVALGFGIFTANSAYHVSNSDHGWSVGRLGYMSQEMYAYAMAVFARSRQEKNPPWLQHVDRLVASAVRDSMKYLERTHCK